MSGFKDDDMKEYRSNLQGRLQRSRDDKLGRRDTLIDRRLRAIEEEDYDYDDDYTSHYPPYRPTRSFVTGYSRATSGAVTLLYMLIGIGAVVALAFILAPRLIGSIVPDVNVPTVIKQAVASPTPTFIDRGGTILQIQNLNRLETQQFSAERIIEAKTERGNLTDFLFGDKLLLLARGTVIVGVDMSKITNEDITISADGEAITVNLPPTEIFVRALDNEQTRIYSRTTGWLANQDKDLETLARQNGEQEILKAACEAGVMQKAADGASRSLQEFLSIAGFQTVNVNSRAGECVAPVKEK